MQGLLLTALVVLAAVAAAVSPAGAADTSCKSTGTLDVLPLHAPIGVNHEVKFALRPDFQLERLVPHSLSFHVGTPAGPRDLPGGDDTLGATFTAPARGAYSVTAHWQLRSCDDPSVTGDEHAGPVTFRVYPERRPYARFRTSIVPGRVAHAKAPIFSVDYVCPPDTLAKTEPIQLTLWYTVGGSKRPTRSSAQARELYPKGCATGSAIPPKSRSFPWGELQGARIGVLPGTTVRVLGEVKSGSKLIGAVRLRFEPKGDGETIVRDGGSCSGGCAKRIYKY